jgi:HAD superfamily hydrolase (TIGR01509 family)
MLQALIFDFDGLVVDTETPDFQAWQELCQRYGVEMTIETWLPCVGTGATTAVFDPYDYLLASVAPGIELDRASIYAQCRERGHELIAAQPILPGVKELILAAKERGLRLAVASSSPRVWVESHLARLGLLDYFEALACGDEVAHTKPYPDLYLSALEKIGVVAGQAVALEDSLNGMLAAQRAGLFCVLIPGLLTQYSAFEQIDLRLNSLAEITLDQLEQHLVDARKAPSAPGARAFTTG